MSPPKEGPWAPQLAFVHHLKLTFLVRLVLGIFTVLEQLGDQTIYW